LWDEETRNTTHALDQARTNHGPHRRRAPSVQQVEHEDSQASSHVDVDSPHISSVSSSFAGETDTQIKREEREAEQAAEEAKQKFKKAEAEASKKYKEGKDKAGAAYKKLQKSAKKDAQELSDNIDNPVFIANGIILGVGAIVLRYARHV